MKKRELIIIVFILVIIGIIATLVIKKKTSPSFKPQKNTTRKTQLRKQITGKQGQKVQHYSNDRVSLSIPTNGKIESRSYLSYDEIVVTLPENKAILRLRSEEYLSDEQQEAQIQLYNSLGYRKSQVLIERSPIVAYEGAIPEGITNNTRYTTAAMFPKNGFFYTLEYGYTNSRRIERIETELKAIAGSIVFKKN